MAMGRVFTLDEARALLPQVIAFTEPVFQLASSLAQELNDVERAGDEDRAEELRERIQTLVETWAEAVRELGAEVKGLWLVDFDAGDGFWCWAYPEEALDHWHGYDTGFSGRVHVEVRPVPSHP